MRRRFRPQPLDETPDEVPSSRRRRSRIRSLVDLAFSDVISASDGVVRAYDFAMSDAIGVDDEMADDQVKLISDMLVPTDSLTPQMQITRTIQDVLTINDGFTVQTSRGARSCDLTPDPTIGDRSNVRLTWPYVSPSLTLELRNPEFGDTEDVSTQAQMLRSRSGQLNPVRGANWPTIRVLSFRFVALSEQQKDDFVAFVEASAADDIGLLDHYGRQWKGLLLFDAAEFVQVGRGCQYEAAFKFRGIIV